MIVNEGLCPDWYGYPRHLAASNMHEASCNETEIAPHVDSQRLRGIADDGLVTRNFLACLMLVPPGCLVNSTWQNLQSPTMT